MTVQIFFCFPRHGTVFRVPRALSCPSPCPGTPCTHTHTDPHTHTHNTHRPTHIHAYKHIYVHTDLCIHTLTHRPIHTWTQVKGQIGCSTFPKGEMEIPYHLSGEDRRYAYVLVAVVCNK